MCAFHHPDMEGGQGDTQRLPPSPAKVTLQGGARDAQALNGRDHRLVVHVALPIGGLAALSSDQRLQARERAHEEDRGAHVTPDGPPSRLPIQKGQQARVLDQGEDQPTRCTNVEGGAHQCELDKVG